MARSSWRRCAPCGGVCRLHGESWVCAACGEGWTVGEERSRLAPASKRCCRCGVEKPADQFGRFSRHVDGLESRCKACRIEAQREWRERNRPRVRELNHRWYEKNREELRARADRWKAENPDAKRAHSKVQKAMQSGKLVRPEACQSCGEPCRPDAHHEDYMKPLVVVWLCAPCHHRLHRDQRQAA